MKNEKRNYTSNEELSQNKTMTENTAADQKKPLRYSDEDLAEFKELILAKLESSQMDFELIKDFISLDSENGTNDTNPTYKLMEDGADVSAKEESANHAIRLK